MPDQMMLFAAGKGTRMAPLTDTTPKPLIPVAGRTLLDRAVEIARAGGVRRIVVNTHHLGDQIKAAVAGQPDITISDESGALLETGGGLKKALPLFAPGPVITMNPDVVWTGPNPVAALRAAWRDDMDALLMVVPLAQAQGRVGAGDFDLTPQGRLLRKGDYVYTGCQIIRLDRLADIAQDAFSLNILWDELLAKGRVNGIVHPGGWCDVGRPDCIPLAQAMLDA